MYSYVYAYVRVNLCLFTGLVSASPLSCYVPEAAIVKRKSPLQSIGHGTDSDCKVVSNTPSIGSSVG